MAYMLPDLGNLRMQSIDDFVPSSSLSAASTSPPSPAVKTAAPPPDKSSKTFGDSFNISRSSFHTSRTTPPAIKTFTPPPEQNSKPYGASLESPRFSPSYSSRSSSPRISNTVTPPPEKSNNPYTSNNPWLSSRPDLTRYQSYSLDLPRPNAPLAAKETGLQVESARNSVSLTRPEEDSVAATFGLGHLHEIKEFVEYDIWNASLTNMRVCPVDLDGQYLYVAHRSFLPNRPGVVVHSGTTKEGAVMGVAHLDFFSTWNTLGVGDPEGAPMSVVWEKMHKESFWTHMRYSFTWDVVVTVKGLTETEKHVFEWHRTKNNFLWDDQGDLVLVEKGKDEVLALYEGKGVLGQVPGKIRGNLKIKPKPEGFHEGWEMMVLLGWASVVELSRRRTRSRRISSIFGHI
jgi:hypothetical protein